MTRPPPLTLRRYKAISAALSLALAGEWDFDDDGFNRADAEIAAKRIAHEIERRSRKETP